jgi:hypothetical protein
MKIKTLILTTAAAMMAVTGIKADTVVTTTPTGDHVYLWNDPGAWWGSRFYYEHDNSHLFNANEFTFDLFASYIANERHFTAFPNTNIRHGRWGGGLGLNYFWSRDVGIGVDASAQTESQTFVDHVGGNLIVRFPIDAIRLAPYVFAGGGRKFDPTDAWFGDGGAGLEFRLNPHMGLFGDARYVWVERNNLNGTRDEALLRAGLRLAF